MFEISTITKAIPSSWLLYASYANFKDGASQGGLIVFLKGKNGNIALICWSSRKIRRVCRSTLAAETMALLEASETCCWLSHIINELLETPLEKSEIFTDNKSLFEAAHPTTAVKECQRIKAIRESISRGEFTLQWIETKNQSADSLTKQGADSSRLIEALNNNNRC